MILAHKTPEQMLAAATERFEQLPAARAERVKLDGDGWLDVTIPRETLRHPAVYETATTPGIAAVVQDVTPEFLTLRIAQNDNHHAFSAV